MKNIVNADCIEAMRDMEPESVTAIITDPPYGISFMGKEWDHGVPGVPFWTEALRVLKPGGHALIFGGTRTFHRLACAVEDAGFEIRDCLSWMYGQGFPKSHDVSKAIDKAAGADRPVIGRGKSGIAKGSDDRNFEHGKRARLYDAQTEFDMTAPATDAARHWNGYGTALKPAWEPIILARKPLAGTVAANCLEHGTGALNIDGCRIDRDPDDVSGWSVTGSSASANRAMSSDNYAREPRPDASGRWPANVLLDPEAAAMLDAQSGTRKGGVRKGMGYHGANGDGGPAIQGSEGGASRFFYCAKASKKDRGPDNNHPTVKPIELMRWLVRLVTGPDPEASLILDPFAGSGTTGVAAQLEGIPFVLIEREAKYVEIIKNRLR